MRKIASTLFVMTLSTSALAATQLGGDQLKQLVAGNTVSLHSIAKSADYKNHYAADGTAYSLQESNGKKNKGAWRISDTGEWCVLWTGASERCGQVFDNGDGTYNRMEDGSLRSVWKKIEQGNTIPE
jgi:hypothetical protein